MFGCAVKLLTGRHCLAALSSPDGLRAPLSDVDVRIAAGRLRAEFAFVGIHERWNDTVVAFHRRMRPYIPFAAAPIISSSSSSRSSGGNYGGNYGGEKDLRPALVELLPTRQRKRILTGGEFASPAVPAVDEEALLLAEAAALGYTKDPFDGPLYEEAIRIFESYA